MIPWQEIDQYGWSELSGVSESQSGGPRISSILAQEAAEAQQRGEEGEEGEEKDESREKERERKEKKRESDYLQIGTLPNINNESGDQ